MKVKKINGEYHTTKKVIKTFVTCGLTNTIRDEDRLQRCDNKKHLFDGFVNLNIVFIIKDNDIVEIESNYVNNRIKKFRVGEFVPTETLTDIFYFTDDDISKLIDLKDNSSIELQ